MPADNYEPDEDPLPGSNSAPVLDDEEEEAGAGVDYRRMFKGYSSPTRITPLIFTGKTRKNSILSRSVEKRTLSLMGQINNRICFKKAARRCILLYQLMLDCITIVFCTDSLLGKLVLPQGFGL